MAISGAAGRVVLEVYARDAFSVDYKAAGDPVTAADRRANALLVERLGDTFPGIPIVAEESVAAAYEGFREAERILFVDPLDGTREFVDRNGEFAVMIGLVEGSRAVAGVVHAPVAGLTWAGTVGVGAWEVDRPSRWSAIRVSPLDTLAGARVVASRSHRGPRLARALAGLSPRLMRAMGSAGLKGAEVARGGADLYVDTGSKTKRWDACAVDALVTAAGGRVSDVTGMPIDYRGRSLANEHGLVATNGLLHEAVLASLARDR